MKTENKVCEDALRCFSEGYNCAQSVLLALSKYWRLESEVIPKIATCFGAGIGRCGSLCGALTGGIMSISLKYGTNEPSPNTRKEAYELARAIYERFKMEHGSVLCAELIGLTLSNPDDLEKARKNKVFDKVCRKFVRSTVLNVLAVTH